MWELGALSGLVGNAYHANSTKSSTATTESSLTMAHTKMEDQLREASLLTWLLIKSMQKQGSSVTYSFEHFSFKYSK